jgi:hypothetical protein
MERCHVVDAFGHHPRQFLQPGVAVELERVEFALAGSGRLHPGLRDDARLGLHLHFAQLLPQPAQVVLGVGQRGAQRAHFVFQARAGDRHLAGLVDEPVQDIGAHAHQRCLGCRRFGVGRRCHCGGGRHRSGRRVLQLLEQQQRMVVMGQQVLERGRCRVAHAFDMGFHLVRMLPQAHGAGHARTALQRMQHALQRGRLRGVGRCTLPGTQRGTDLRQQVGALFQEHGQQIGIEFVGHGRTLRRRRRRGPRREPGQRQGLHVRLAGGRAFCGFDRRRCSDFRLRHGSLHRQRFRERIVERGVEQVVDRLVLRYQRWP